MKETSIKEALQNGATEDELIEQLKKQIHDANVEMEQEAEKKKEIAKHEDAVAAAHNKLIADVKEYFDVLGWDLDDESMATIESMTKEALDRLESVQVTSEIDGDDDLWRSMRRWMRHWFPW